MGGPPLDDDAIVACGKSTWKVRRPATDDGAPVAPRHRERPVVLGLVRLRLRHRLPARGLYSHEPHERHLGVPFVSGRSG